MPIGTYTPPPGKTITQFFFSNFFFFFFHFRCILLQISHQKCFFISISIPGRSGVKQYKPDSFMYTEKQLQFNRYRNELKKTITHAKRSHYQDLFKETLQVKSTKLSD